MSEKLKTNEIKKQLSDSKLSILSMTSVFSTEMIHERFSDSDKSEFIIPDFQRFQRVWTEDVKSKFIESIFIGIPINNILTYEIEGGKLEIIDGLQRLNSVYEYLENTLELCGLEILSSLNNTKFEDLPEDEKAVFKRKSLNFTVLHKHNDESVKYELFYRINYGQEPLEPQEKREGSQKASNLSRMVTELSQKYYFVFSQMRSKKFSAIRKYDRELIARCIFLFSRFPNLKGKFEIQKELDDMYKKSSANFTQDKCDSMKNTFES
jgi:hypothetical protein